MFVTYFLFAGSGSGTLGTLIAQLEDQDSEKEIISPLSSDHSPLHPFSTLPLPSTPPPQNQPTSNLNASAALPSGAVIPPHHPPKENTGKLPEKVPKHEKAEKLDKKRSHTGEYNKSKSKKRSKSPKSSNEVSKLSKTMSHHEATKLETASQISDLSKEAKDKTFSNQACSSMEVNLPSSVPSGEQMPLNMKCHEDLTELIELQRKLQLLRDRSRLQRVVDVIEKTGQFNITSSTFDFDLCSLDKTTVIRLQKCLDATS